MTRNDKKRDVRASFLLNKDEAECIERYLAKYKISNKSRWMRETLITAIFQNMGRDYPTLFDENEMRR